MIALDTNLLVYAHQSLTTHHREARKAIEAAAGRDSGFGVPVACIAEFWSVVTHTASIGRASTPEEAARFFRHLVEDAALSVLAPGPNFGERLAQTAADLAVRGARVFDLQIGLTALDAGATEIWTHDQRFVRIPGLRVVDPLRASSPRIQGGR